MRYVGLGQRVQGKCPSCGGTSLFLAEDGYVTCSRMDCEAPEAADAMLHGEQPDRPAPVDPASVAKVKAEALREAADAYWDDTTKSLRPSVTQWLHERADRLEQPDPQLVEALYQKLYETHNGGGDGSPPDERWNETYRHIAVRLARAGVEVPDDR